MRSEPHGAANEVHTTPLPLVLFCVFTHALLPHYRSHHRAAEVDPSVMPGYKISGAFIPGTDGYFGAADSSGNILVLQTGGKAAPAIDASGTPSAPVVSHHDTTAAASSS